jgi:hypothetical protein
MNVFFSNLFFTWIQANEIKSYKFTGVEEQIK